MRTTTPTPEDDGPSVAPDLFLDSPDPPPVIPPEAVWQAFAVAGALLAAAVVLIFAAAQAGAIR